ALYGLYPQGHGQLLGQTIFTAVMVYAHLVTMSTSESKFTVEPLITLPKGHGPVEKLKTRIRDELLTLSNRDIIKNKELMELATDMGSDLCINTFAVNFKTADGRKNEDVMEANALNARILKRLSIVDPKTTRNTVPLILMSTVLSQAAYQDSLDVYKARLGLRGQQDLYVLVNTNMSPFATEFGILKEIMKALTSIIEEEVDVALYRNTLKPARHDFVMQGTEKIFLANLPMYNMENHRQQLVITGDLPDEVKQEYVDQRAQNPNALFVLRNTNDLTLDEVLSTGEFRAQIYKVVTKLKE
ncbi:hypothetical protein SISNIDRAFT_403791, partial [Sistotremastrum niveocremeum HHB9708]